jgi:transcriptional regulator with XRE-family HTH domain
MSQDTHTPDPVDIHVGERIRLLRKNADMSQQQLGELLDVTFQQIQKYERGTNRISGSMMWRAAGALGVTPNDFYEGLQGPSVNPDSVKIVALQAGAAARAFAMMPVLAEIPTLPRHARAALKGVIDSLVHLARSPGGEEDEKEAA